MAVISAPISPISSSYTQSRGGARNFDWVMLALVALLSIWGCFTVASAIRPAESASPTRSAARSAAVKDNGGSAVAGAAAVSPGRMSDVTKQVIWILVGLAALAALALSDYQWLMHLQGWLYALNLLLLVLVLKLPTSIAPEINGAKSWIKLGPFALQPAEFSKVALIVALAAFLCRRQARRREFSTLLWSLLYLALPLLLILKQNDFGTMLAVLSIWFGMMFFGGARWWHLGLVVLIGATLFGAAWHTDKLKPHQKARLAVFLDPNPSSADARREAYQITQSQIAIGGGGVTGQGWGKGMQNRAGYVPEKTTDFIFAVVAEELGFVGAATLLVAYLVLLSRSAMVALSTDNYFGALIAGGFTFLLAFHTIVNLGMTMRLMPITGVPLPFFSYGGSSYLAFSLCVGLLQSISLRRKRIG
ncbi:MAG TPA: rod shape-determining protein RodA [Abditibacteriaceae bacterium]|nr:rod shape-determining protein RodA [Abditibacteriaceae bacterium]